ncbi:hypothetical protein SmJEL517_g04511 [Synchytrium microbalum]|uniref:LysM domain-containing protein n=1 Tax=Synchytrium microbalum TaxID=1806994 RepID=A0A507BRR1_9FUNG|nr:uncharacterized protein SmJEL517_g04511 [Synchytrium microbalum]TPX32360.1 hypothetical protein SmJEL517_g04511 [Synchytrium microbalum]
MEIDEEFTDEAPPPYTSIVSDTTLLTSETDTKCPKPNEAVDTTADTRRIPGVVHYVIKNETLWGIAISYGIDVNTIKLANRLMSDDIYSVGSLFIPGATVSKRAFPDEEEVRRSLVKRFQLISKCTDVHESTSYVSRCGYDVGKALEEYWSDLNWEVKQGGGSVKQGGSSSAVYDSRAGVTGRRREPIGSGKWKRIS